MRLRQALVNDAEAISRIRVLAWQAAYGNFMPKGFLDALDPLANIDSWREKLTRPIDGWIVSVADVEDSTVAFSVVGAPRYPTSERCTELWALNVHPDFWRLGIGRILINRAVDTAAATGSRRIELWCIHGNLPARAAYEKCGFAPTGQERSSSQLTGQPLHEILYAREIGEGTGRGND